jgi:cytidylate kinase
MNANSTFVITINREAGSGGRTVGRLLAEKLGVNFYDKIIIESLVQEFDLSPEEIESLKAEKRGKWEELCSKILSAPSMGYSDDFGKVTSADLFRTESSLIRHLAENHSCVIAGRSAFHALKDHPGRVSVFIWAPKEKRLERLISKHKIPAGEGAEEILDRLDKSRENYTSRFCGVDRHDCRNYDLVINMDSLTEKQAVKIILDYLKTR